MVIIVCNGDIISLDENGITHKKFSSKLCSEIPVDGKPLLIIIS